MLDVCVLLSGCGMYDGSEPHETVLLLAALARRGARSHCVAPATEQVHVVDHRSGDEMEGSRDVLTESARLSRGKVSPVGEFPPERADALVIPGGYGVGKHLMSGFADPAERLAVRPEVRALVEHFVSEGKPVGAISLGKLLLEAVVPDCFTERLRTEEPGEIYVDEDRHLLYTPGYLAGDRLDQILPGIEALAERLFHWCAEEETG